MTSFNTLNTYNHDEDFSETIKYYLNKNGRNYSNLTFILGLYHYSKNDFESLIKESVTKNIKDQSKTLVDVNYYSLKKDVITYDVDKGTAQIKVAGQAYVASQVNEEQLKKNLVGKSVSQSNGYFTSFQEVDHVDFRFWPKWYQKMPLLKSRIQIELKYQPKQNNNSSNSTDNSNQTNQNSQTPTENQKALDKLE